MRNKKRDELAHILGTKIKTVSGELKQSNGNKGINQSDMLWYLTQKIDSIYTSINDIKDDINKQFVTKEFCHEVHKNIDGKESLQIKQKRFSTERMMSGVSMFIAVCAIIMAAVS